MALRKTKLGELIEQVLETNSDLKYGLDDVMGMTLTKEIIPTKADINPKELPKFIVVSQWNFIFNPRTHGKKIGFGFNAEDRKFLISWNNIAFKIKEEKKTSIVPYYLWIWLKRDEWDRFATFNSWGSSTEVFSWESLCDMDIDLPDLPTQEKFVKVYLSMLENQKAYERGLEDLKLVCDGYIEDLRRKMPSEEIGSYIVCTDRKTDNPNLKIQGISNQQKLNDSNSRVDGVDTEKYLRIDSGEFGYSPIHINDGSIALNSSDNSYLLSPIYKTFKVRDENKLLPEYLMMWFSRKEFIRYCTFHAFGSARDTFEWEQMCKVAIPIPDKSIQQSVVNIYSCYQIRKEINEQLKNQIKDICPILIKGSIEEAKGV